MQRRVKRLLIRVVVLFLLSTAAGVWVSMNSPYRAFNGEVFLNFERGTGTRAMAVQLADAGVIEYRWQFWIARLLRPSAKLQAGEYQFDRDATVREVFDRIARGDVYHFDFTVPEGSNMFDIAARLESENVMSGEDFLKAASNVSLIVDLTPTAKSLEGYLFPSTYRLSHSINADDLCKMMVQAFRREWTRMAANAGVDAGDVHRAVTLASLVEKETAVTDERALVASVFANRLKASMRLECDPTVIYAALIDKRYSGVIHQSDLARRNPYNTYQNDGLPPGPIANPGAASIEAALHPAQTTYLYFVAKPEGGSHVFSSTLAAHQRAVQSYRHGPQTRKSVPAKAPRKAG